MSNERNEWGVPLSDIKWLTNALRSHQNITEINRDFDIVFTVSRKKQKDQLKILLLRQYAMSLTLTQRAQIEFNDLNIIYIGGGWCSYTQQAKQYAVASGLGLFVTDELLGALWKYEYWNHYKKDEDGDPEYFYKAE